MIIYIQTPDQKRKNKPVGEYFLMEEVALVQEETLLSTRGMDCKMCHKRLQL